MVKIVNSHFIRKAREGIFVLYEKLIAPRAVKEDLRRREMILNIILSSSIIFLGFLDLSVLYNSLAEGAAYRGVSFSLFSLILLSFVALYVLSRRGRFIVASYALTGLYFIAITYAAMRWGPDLQIVVLSYVLLISIASILVSTHYGFIIAFIVAISVALLAHLQSVGVVVPQAYWKTELFSLNDAIQLGALYFLLMVMFWLSNREIERSLTRARQSEAALLRERDLLEVKVEERTSELKMVQLEKMSQLYRFAEFGRLATGIFHDLVNPLTALSLHMGQLKGEAAKDINSTNYHLEKAIGVTKRMEGLIQALRRQTAYSQEKGTFSLNTEIKEALDLLSFKAKKASVIFVFEERAVISMVGNAMKFHQVVSNLMSNAIDSYEEISEDSQPHPVLIALDEVEGRAIISVADQGAGISQQNLSKIYEPFFTTKVQGKGTGIGLTVTKDIVTSEFGGQVELLTKEGGGTTFTVTLPLGTDSKK